MGALSPEEAAAQARAAEEVEVRAPAAPLDPDRGSITAGDDDRVSRARYEAGLAADRAERALRAFGEAADPRDASAVRGTLMRGLEPARSVGPTRADLREDFEIAGLPDEEELVFGGGVIESRPVREMTVEELEAALQGMR